MPTAQHSNLQRRITTLFGFSIVDILLMAGVFILLVLYVVLLIHLKPSLKFKKSLEEHSASDTPTQIQDGRPSTTSANRNPMPIQINENPEEPPTQTEPLGESNVEIHIPQKEYSAPSGDASKIRERLLSRAETPKRDRPPGCSYYFGFLGELPKNTSIPDECLGCLKIMECLTKRPRASQT